VTQPLHVLLVDDRPSHLDSLGLRLQRNGYRTSLAPNAREALATAQSDPPDVAVLDVSASEPEGFETCRALKQLLPQVPVIIYAASKIANDRSLADSCGADEIIEAPADRALVMQRIVQLLAR
jgi:two-component system, OmpR family, response regulator